MISTLSFNNPLESLVRRIRREWTGGGDQFDFVLLCEFSMLSFGYHSVLATDRQQREF
jgi:hypothetical protein